MPLYIIVSRTTDIIERTYEVEAESMDAAEEAFHDGAGVLVKQEEITTLHGPNIEIQDKP